MLIFLTQLSLSVSSNITQELLPEWDAFIETNPQGSVLQSNFIFNLFKTTRNFEPLLIHCAENEALVGVLLGVLIKEGMGIKGLFSSRMVIYGGPVIRFDHPQRMVICELLLKELVALTHKRSIFTQLRASFDVSEFSGCFSKYGFAWHPRVNLLIGTTDALEVSAGMSSSRKRQVKKSIQNGALVVEPDSLDQIREFFEILRKLYKYRVKKPLPDFSFFKTFYLNTTREGHGKIFLVYFEGKIIGGILCPFDNKTMFEWYVCGLDRTYREKGIYPSVLATWTAIDYAIKNNIRQFDFMGLGKPDVEYGVRDFKLKFGGSIVNYGRWIRINRPVLYWISELGFNLLTLIKKQQFLFKNH